MKARSFALHVEKAQCFMMDNIKRPDPISVAVILTMSIATLRLPQNKQRRPARRWRKITDDLHRKYTPGVVAGPFALHIAAVQVVAVAVRVGR
eukprot:scaffold165367_cov31-Prasinocladus_malaysianus.AAC.1